MQNKGAESKEKEKKDMSSTAMLLVLILVILLMAGIIVWLVFFRKPADVVSEEKPDIVNNRGMVLVTEENAATVGSDMYEDAVKGMFECKMTMTWDYTDGGEHSKNAYVANSTNNVYTIFFDVIEQESGETIYSSPLIPVGGEISDFALNKHLDAGSYKATVMYTLVDQDNDYEEISSAGFVVTLNVTE